MASKKSFYKSFLGQWIAVVEEGGAPEFWFSEDGVKYVPFKYTEPRAGGAYVEYRRGASSWRANLVIDGETVVLSYLAHPRRADKPIFRLQDRSDLGLIYFDPSPEYRVVLSLCKVIATGHLICVTAQNTIADDSVRLYLGTPGHMTPCDILNVGPREIVTNQGVYVNVTSWEGLELEVLELDDYVIKEKEDRISIAKK